MKQSEQAAKQEAEEYGHLVKSPGWQRFVVAVQAEAAFHVEQEMALALDNENDQVAAGRMRQAIAAKRAIERMLRHPAERLQVLTPSSQDYVGTLKEQYGRVRR